MKLRPVALLTPILAATLMCMALPALAQGAEKPRTVTLAVRDASLHHTLELLFRESGHRFEIEGGAGGTVNAYLSDVTWHQALRLILDSQGLTYEVHDNVYRIKPKTAPRPRDVPPDGKRRGGRISDDARLAAGGKERLELIRVRYADPAILAAILGGTSVGFAYGGYGGFSGPVGYGMPPGHGGIPAYGSGYSGFVPGYGRGPAIGRATTSRIPRTTGPGED